MAWIAFLVSDFIPQNCVELNNEEKKIFDKYRRTAGIHPNIFSEEEYKKNKAHEYDQEAIDVLASESEQFLNDMAKTGDLPF
jgi:hypothetical protein